MMAVRLPGCASSTLYRTLRVVAGPQSTPSTVRQFSVAALSGSSGIPRSNGASVGAAVGIARVTVPCVLPTLGSPASSWRWASKSTTDGPDAADAKSSTTDGPEAAAATDVPGLDVDAASEPPYLVASEPPYMVASEPAYTKARRSNSNPFATPVPKKVPNVLQAPKLQAILQSDTYVCAWHEQASPKLKCPHYPSLPIQRPWFVLVGVVGFTRTVTVSQADVSWRGVV
jgi:hypothetical protein